MLLLAVALGGYEYERHRTGSIYHPHARFVPEPTPRLPARGPDRFAWPFYGYNKEHTRFFPAPARLHPPFKRLWVHNGGALLEFPPVIRGDHIFQLADDGLLEAISKHTGHTFWIRRLGSLSASSPAVVGNTVYATVLARTDGIKKGLVAAVDYTTGAVIWSRALPSPSESSPLVDHGMVFFGSQNGTVYALNIHNGAPIWTYHAGGRGQGQPDAVRRRAVLRRLLRASAGDLRADRPPAVGLGLGRGAARQRHLLLDRRRRSTGACSSATPTGACTPTTRPRAGSTGPCRRAGTCMPRPRS